MCASGADVSTGEAGVVAREADTAVEFGVVVPQHALAGSGFGVVDQGGVDECPEVCGGVAGETVESVLGAGETVVGAGGAIVVKRFGVESVRAFVVAEVVQVIVVFGPRVAESLSEPGDSEVQNTDVGRGVTDC